MHLTRWLPLADMVIKPGQYNHSKGDHLPRKHHM
jgi:hypothetical protein